MTGKPLLHGLTRWPFIDLRRGFGMLDGRERDLFPIYTMCIVLSVCFWALTYSRILSNSEVVPLVEQHIYEVSIVGGLIYSLYWCILGSKRNLETSPFVDYMGVLRWKFSVSVV